MSALSNVKKFFPQVTSVVDATRKQMIEVLSKDVNPKAAKKHDQCAMALACKRKFHLDGVIISRTTAYLVKGKRARRFKLSEAVSREITSFDRGASFEPGVYTLEKIYPTMELGARKGNRPRGDRGSQSKRTYHTTTNIRKSLREK